MEAMSFMVRLAADCTRLVFFAHAHIDIAVSSEFFELHLERRISRRSASPLAQAPHGCLLARLTSPGSPFHAPRRNYPWGAALRRVRVEHHVHPTAVIDPAS